MVRRILIFFVLMLSLSAYTYFGDNGCPTKSANSSMQSRSLTCGSCHGATNVDIIITEGKVVEGVYEFQLDFEGSDEMQALELFVEADTDTRVVNYGSTPGNVTPIGTSLFFALNDGTKKTGDPLLFYWEAPDRFFEPATIRIQGVVSNADGTVEGDLLFEKSLSVYPKQLAHPALYPSVANTSVTLDNTELYTSFQIVNVLGKVVSSGSILNDKTQVRVSNLEDGNYFLLLDNGYNRETLRFVVKK